jgi:hypothetical protein
MKPLLRVVLIVNALIFLAFGVLFLLTPWASLYSALQLDGIRVQPAFAGQLFGVVLLGMSWLSFHAAIDGALTARAARVSGHVEWISGVIVLVWLLGIRTPEVDAIGQMTAAIVGIVLMVLGLGSARLSSVVRRRERAAQAGAVSAERAEKRAAKARDEKRDAPVIVTPPDTAIRPSARAPEATAIDPITGRTVPVTMAATAPTRERLDGGAVDPVTGATLDPVTGQTLDPVTGREIDPVTGRRIEPVISGGIDPATGRRVDGPSGAPR